MDRDGLAVRVHCFTGEVHPACNRLGKFLGSGFAL
jgi:hypothetical protein